MGVLIAKDDGVANLRGVRDGADDDVADATDATDAAGAVPCCTEGVGGSARGCGGCGCDWGTDDTVSMENVREIEERRNVLSVNGTLYSSRSGVAGFTLSLKGDC